jgi:alanyl-tRNA synthetase
MRRAMRHAQHGEQRPCDATVMSTLVQQMGAAYPELGKAVLIEDTLLNEEVRFKATLIAVSLLDDELLNVPKDPIFSGKPHSSYTIHSAFP